MKEEGKGERRNGEKRGREGMDLFVMSYELSSDTACHFTQHLTCLEEGEGERRGKSGREREEGEERERGRASDKWNGLEMKQSCKGVPLIPIWCRWCQYSMSPLY